MRLQDDAQARHVAVVWDDEDISLGMGEGSRTWRLDALTDETPWAALHDVPSALVTGSNGKTTTVRLVATMLGAGGRVAGFNCTDGVFVGGEGKAPTDAQLQQFKATWNLVAKRAGGGSHFVLMGALLVAVVWLPAALWVGVEAAWQWGWVGLSLLLALGSLLGMSMPSVLFDWQPAQALTEPWRWWTAAWVHWSGQHLLANLAGAAVLAALGLAARLPAHAALAWLLAWPLTQLGLLARPDLARFGGLSGVLHAGVAIAVLQLLLHERGRRRWVGAALGLGLLAKLALEAPWGPALRNVAGWDIALAPWSHASGALAGVLAGLIIQTLVSAWTHVETKTDTNPIDTCDPS